MINGFGKVKPRISMTTKGSSRRQIIVHIDNDYILNFIKSFGSYITNLNRTFKNIKSEIMADFIQSDQHRIIITTNKITLLSNLYTIENYIENTNNINFNNIMTSHLPQSKSYLKIIGISYLIENTNTLINLVLLKLLSRTHTYSTI